MTKRILVADGSITIQKIVAMAFENEDAVVEGVSNGKDALEKMRAFQPDIVLADVDMPGLTGLELSKKIKGDPKFNLSKVLLLASDFEDFNENLFKDSGADDHISKPFKSDDIVKRVVDLLSENKSAPNEETIKLTMADMDESIKPAEATFELSVSDLIEEIDPTVELTSADLEETIKPRSKEETAKESEEGVLDEMIEGIESLKGTTEPIGNELDDASPTREDEIGDELDTAFHEIVNFGLGKKSGDTPNFRAAPISESADIDTIIPEPEDLLEKMTPSTSASKKGASGPNLIQESLSYFSQISHEPKVRQAMNTHWNEQLKNLSQPETIKDGLAGEEHIRKIIEKEIADLSNSLTESVREVVREIAPKIAREIIKEEIDKIKKL